MYQLLDCIDAGSDYCPCYLAETGECLICSQLQGKTFCDCKNWKGVCIYQEYVWNGRRMKEQRRNISCELVDKKIVSQDVIIIKIRVNKTMARELNQPGAYVFLRKVDVPGYFDTPMSVMAVNEKEGTADIAVQVRGVKSKALNKEGDMISLRGPYWNGVLGLKFIKGLRHSSALLVLRGIGQASAVPVARKLRAAGNRVEVILDQGRSGVNFAGISFLDLGCKITEKPLLDRKTLQIPQETQEYIKARIMDNGIRLVYSGGSDKLNTGMALVLASLPDKVYFACSNNARFCCGEGICGSCHTRLGDGSRVKTCKTQLNPVELFAREVDNKWQK